MPQHEGQVHAGSSWISSPYWYCSSYLQNEGPRTKEKKKEAAVQQEGVAGLIHFLILQQLQSQMYLQYTRGMPILGLPRFPSPKCS